MILCFTGTGERTRVGNMTLSQMWVQRARTLGAARIIDSASNVGQAQQMVSQLSGTFDKVYFIGHGSSSGFYFFATHTPFGLSGTERAKLNLSQLNMPSDPSYQQTYNFFQALAPILPPIGGKLIFECCLLGTNLNLGNVQNTLATLGKRCSVQGYQVQINWRVNGSRVNIHQGANRSVTLP